MLRCRRIGLVALANLARIVRRRGGVLAGEGLRPCIMFYICSILPVPDSDKDKDKRNERADPR